MQAPPKGNVGTSESAHSFTPAADNQEHSVYSARAMKEGEGPQKDPFQSSLLCLHDLDTLNTGFNFIFIMKIHRNYLFYMNQFWSRAVFGQSLKAEISTHHVFTNADENHEKTRKRGGGGSWARPLGSVSEPPGRRPTPSIGRLLAEDIKLEALHVDDGPNTAAISVIPPDARGGS